MQLKFLLAALASTLPFQAAAQVFPTGIVGGEIGQAISDINAYYATLSAAPAITSVYSVLETATVNIHTIVLDPTPMGWYTVPPTQIQPYFSSVEAAVFSIVNRDLDGTAAAVPTSAASAGAGVKYTAMIAAASIVTVALI